MGELEAVAVAATDRPARTAIAPHDDERAAWLAALSLALLAAPLLALLAKPVGTLFVPRLPAGELMPWATKFFRPEPAEQGLYLLALAAVAALAGILLLAPRRLFAMPERTTAALAPIARALLALVLLMALLGQYRIRYEWTQGLGGYRFFTPVTLILAALIAAALVAALHSDELRRRLGSVLRESRARRVAAGAIAVVLTAVWMLHAIQSDSSLAWAPGEVLAHLPYTSDETFAVVNGLTPLVNAHLLYASLWPYVLALPLALFGRTLLVFTLATATLTALALLAGFGILRRAAGSSIGALALYLPFLATSLFIYTGTSSNRVTPATSLADFPLRYAAPLLLAWLTARELDRRQRHAPWALFAAVGLVLVNNVGVGLPALAATTAAVVATRPGTRRTWAHLAGAAIGGLLLAGAAISLLTLVRAGALPHFGQLSAFSRLYLAGYGSTPAHSLFGLHLAVFLTFAAALTAGAVRARSRAPGRVMTGMLLWTGVFGLGAFSYFVAESGPRWLLASFSTWALALMLLAILVLRRLAARGARRPDPADLAVLFGLGLTVCSLAQVPAPWSQIERLTGAHHGRRALATEVNYVPDQRARVFLASLPDGQRFFLKRGAPVAFLFDNGHRTADAYGVVDVSPYANPFEMFTWSSLRDVVAALRRAGGNTVVTSQGQEPAADIDAGLIRLGFGIVTAHGIVRVTAGVNPISRVVRGETLVKWVDLRNLHPRALREGRGRQVPAAG